MEVEVGKNARWARWNMFGRKEDDQDDICLA
jgi:hypothetical protein